MCDTTSLPELPIELSDYILDNLWNDRRTLEACSLVCRTWLPTTRLHLFHALSLSGRHEVSHLESTLHGRLPTIPDFTRYIRSLSLVSIYPLEDWLGPTLPSSFQQLGHIRHLRLTRFTPTCFEWQPVVEELAVLFPDISELCLEDIRMDEPRRLRHMLSAFPALSALKVTSGIWLSNASQFATIRRHWVDELESDLPQVLGDEVLESGTSVDVKRMVQIRKLELGHGLYNDATALLLLNAPFQLRALEQARISWTYIRDSALPIFTSFLAKCAETVMDLQIMLNGYTSREPLLNALRALQFPELRTLHFGIVHLPGGIPDMRWIPAMLRSLQNNSTNIQQIKLSLNIAGLDSLGVLSWRDIDAQLSALAEQFMGFTLSIVVTSCLDEVLVRADVVEDIKNRLEHARELLGEERLEVTCPQENDIFWT